MCLKYVTVWWVQNKKLRLLPSFKVGFAGRIGMTKFAVDETDVLQISAVPP